MIPVNADNYNLSSSLEYRLAESACDSLHVPRLGDDLSSQGLNVHGEDFYQVRASSAEDNLIQHHSGPLRGESDVPCWDMTQEFALGLCRWTLS